MATKPQLTSSHQQTGVWKEYVILYFLKPASLVSILFPLHFLWYRQREFV